MGVLVAPVIPGLNDHELPAILAAAAQAGAKTASYIVLRLPHAVKEVFLAWLDVHAPTKKARIVDRIREIRGGQLYDSRFGAWMRGQGIFAEQIRRVFAVAARRAGLETRQPELSNAAFRRPAGDDLHRRDGTQLELL